MLQDALQKWGKTTFMDGTHNVVNQSRTLTTLVVRVKETEDGLICAWFVHSKKTSSTYAHFLRCVSRAAPEWKPTHFVLDFEVAERLAVSQIFPTTNITLCYFHLQQSVRRFCKQHQIAQDVTGRIHKAIEKLQASASRAEFIGNLQLLEDTMKKIAPFFWSYFSSNYIVNGISPYFPS